MRSENHLVLSILALTVLVTGTPWLVVIHACDAPLHLWCWHLWWLDYPDCAGMFQGRVALGLWALLVGSAGCVLAWWLARRTS